MAINAYNSANGTYLVYDSAAKPERNTTASGTWLTAAQLQSNSLTVIDWFCLVSAAGTPPQTQQYKLMATSVGEGTVHFGNGLKYTTVGQGTYVNFQTTPGAYHHVESVCVGGTYYEVKNNGGDADLSVLHAVRRRGGGRDVCPKYSGTDSALRNGGGQRAGNGSLRQ